MLSTAPPLPPVRVAVADPGESNIRARLWVLSTTFFSLLVTAWCCSLGPIAAIIALVAEKHVLVALLAAWIDITAPQRA